ncbi:hypothetical protein DQT79_26215 [Salmonella enterica subsp. enterica serovar Oranienburg]|nr:hypothetical protein [Salmonella enterica subsp. enterica serovar Oranienburg]
MAVYIPGRKPVIPAVFLCCPASGGRGCRSVTAGTPAHAAACLRHACGYALADNGVDTRLIQDYLGHRNIRHTVRYTASNAARFDGIWTPGRRRGRQLFDPKCNILLTDGQILSDTHLPRQ